MSIKTISILGSTGSVGRSTVEVICAQPELFKVEALTARDNAELLAEQAIRLGARLAVIDNQEFYPVLRERLAGTGIEAASGRQAIIEAAGRPCDLVVAAIVGFAGLEPIMAAIGAGAHVALANKEPLVAAGPLVIEAARSRGVRLLPVDSEHNAVFQVFDEANRERIERIILTASGGPFRTWDIEKMNRATPEQAVAHPNWVMGRKISVDSASMMNKALEVIEAHYLFDLPAEQIDVVIHPQSIIHSMVEYSDGSVLAQMGAPDMKTPIAYCLGWPDRIRSPGQKMDFGALINLDIQPLDRTKFPAVDMAYECLKAGAAHCIAFNAANEAAVEAFLTNRIGFGAITRVIAGVLEETSAVSLKSVADIVLFDETVRSRAKIYIDKIGTNDEVHAA